MTNGLANGAPGWLVEVPLAHRGLFSDGVPENSIPAFEAAVAAGVGVELDVRLTSDGIPVIAHDRSLLRSTGHDVRLDQIPGSVLAELRLTGTDLRVPTLDEVLSVVDGRVPVMVEVKNESARSGVVEAATAEVLADRVEAGHPLVVASFNPLAVRWFERFLTDVPRVLTGGDTDVVPAPARPFLRRMLARHTGAPVALSWDLARLDDPIIVAAREASVPVVTWTVKDLEGLAHARAHADNVIFESLDPEVVRDGP